MTPAPRLQELIEVVRADAQSTDELELLATASSTAAELTDVGDALLDHFVHNCRDAGRSWAEISAALGVSKQAVHKRFSLPAARLERLTLRARATLEAAGDIARHHGHDYIGTEHLLLAQYTQPDALAAKVLVELGATKKKVQARVVTSSPDGPGPSDGTPRFTPKAANVVTRSIAEALELGHNYVGTEHLLLALIHEDGLAAQVLADLGVGDAEVRPVLSRIFAELMAAKPGPL